MLFLFWKNAIDGLEEFKEINEEKERRKKKKNKTKKRTKKKNKWEKVIKTWNKDPQISKKAAIGLEAEAYFRRRLLFGSRSP